MAIAFRKRSLETEKDKLAKEMYLQKKAANLSNPASSNATHDYEKTTANLSGTATEFNTFRKGPVDEEPPKSGTTVDYSKNIQCAKADKGKLPISLVPMTIVKDIAAIRKYGEEKYHAPNNWVLVDKQRYVDAMWRHLIAYQEGEEYDKESGLPHLWHAACNMAFILEMESPDWEIHKQQLIASDPKLQEQLKKYMEDNK
jgi:hypothetical protein